MSVLQNLTAIKMLQLKAFKFQLNNPFKWANGWSAPLYHTLNFAILSASN